jgi:mRNA-degrading endonuclease RelE of RelBE toxin-antitoxin system
MYTINFTTKARKQVNRLPSVLRNKLLKQLIFLADDFHYPSLHTKKMSNTSHWEARIDYHYRFTFIFENNVILILSVGPHDEGLGKK